MYVILEVTSEDRSRKLKKGTIFFWILQQSIVPLNDGEGLRPEIRAVNYTIEAKGRLLGSVPASFFRHPTLPLFFLVPCLCIYLLELSFLNMQTGLFRILCTGIKTKSCKVVLQQWWTSIQEKSEHFSGNYLLSRLGWDESLCRWSLRDTRRKNSCFTKGTKRIATDKDFYLYKIC